MKKGMTLITLVLTIVIIIIISSVIIMNLNNSGIIDRAKGAVDEYNLLHVEQLANMAYASIYLENLNEGIRKDITVEELKARIIKNGVVEEELEKYNIEIIDKDIYITIKEEE